MDNMIVTVLGVAFLMVIAVISVIAIFRTEKVNKSVSTKTGNHKKDNSTRLVAGGGNNENKTQLEEVRPDAKNCWVIYAKAVDGDGILAEGAFDEKFFDVDEYAYHEKHYTIGRASDNDLVISGVYTTVSNYHAYIRYNRSDDSFYYWDNNSSVGTFELKTKGKEKKKERVELSGHNAKVTKGLVLYIGESVYLEFEKKGTR